MPSSWVSSALYMIVVLAGFGGAGVWLPIIQGKNITVDALTTFVMATVSPLVADLIVGDEEFDSFDTDKRMWFLALFGASWLSAITALLRESKPDSWWIGWSAAFLSLMTWLFIAVRSQKFQNRQNGTGPIGGNNPAVSNLGGPGL